MAAGFGVPKAVTFAFRLQDVAPLSAAIQGGSGEAFAADADGFELQRMSYPLTRNRTCLVFCRRRRRL